MYLFEVRGLEFIIDGAFLRVTDAVIDHLSARQFIEEEEQ